MGVSYKKGTFVKATTVTTQDITDVGFQPKAVILWTSNQTVETFEEHMQLCYGFYDGTTNCCMMTQSADNLAASQCGLRAENAFALSLTTRGAEIINAQGLVSTFLSNGFRMSWNPNTTPAAIVHYIAIGGTDITNVKAVYTTVGTDVTGNKSYTGVGFQPDFLLTVNHCTFASTAVPIQVGQAGFALSAMKSTSERWATATASEDGRATSDTWKYQTTTKCFTSLQNSSGLLTTEADFVSFDTDGFTWNYTTTSTGSTNVHFMYLAIKGGVWDVGSFLEPTTDTTVQTNTNANAILKGVQTIETRTTAAAGIVSHNALSVGASDGTNHGVISYHDTDAAGNMIVAQKQNDDNFVYMMVANATATSSTSPGNCTVTFSTSSFTTSWANTDGTQREILFWALSEASQAQQYSRPISETSVPISESLARVQVKLKPISETAVTVSETLTKIPTYVKTISDPSITVSETLVRVQSLIKTISETAVTVSETLARVPIYLKPVSETAITVSEQLTKGLVYTKPINESAISINDTIVRIPLYLKPISDETAITTNDTIARWISVSYTLSEPSISVNDSIAGALFYLRQISESAISVNDTIERILTAIRVISDPSISTNDTIARIQTLLKTISENAISVNDSVAKVPTFVKSISDETAINTNDTIVRILAAVRTITDPSISVNDTITRIQTLLKTITEDAISINDTVQAGLLLTISLVESRIKWYYSVLTRKIV